MKAKIVCMLILFSCASVYACRPLTTDDCGTVEKSKFELEVGYDVCNLFNCTNEHEIGVSLKHGLTESMDIGIFIPFQVQPATEERFGDAVLSVKFGLLKDLLAFSFSNDFGSTAYSMNFVLSKDFGVFNAHLNIGYNTSGDPTVKGLLTYGIAVKYPIDKFELSAESFGDEANKNWLIGGRYEILEKLFIDLGYGKNFTDGSDRTTFGFHKEF